MKFATIPEAIEDIKRGKLVIVVDDEDRENEGDFITAAENATPEIINFMATHGRGLICVPMMADRLHHLDLQPMVSRNTAPMETPFTVSVDAIEGATTGISASDRAQTIKVLIDPKAHPDDLGRPGHIFPLRAQNGGVLVRAGHTEATVDLAKMAGMYPAGVLVEIMNEDGTMARGQQLTDIACRFDIKVISIADLICYRHQTEKLVRCLQQDLELPTRVGKFNLHVYESTIDRHQHLVLIKGDVSGDEPVLVRVHSQCLTGDAFGSLRCDCGDQLESALREIERAGRGVLLYLRQEYFRTQPNQNGAQNLLSNQPVEIIHAQAQPGPSMNLRQYGIGAQILSDLGLKKIRLMTNNPKKIVGLEAYNLEIVEQVPLQVTVHQDNEPYLTAKKLQNEHSLDVVLPSKL